MWADGAGQVEIKLLYEKLASTLRIWELPEDCEQRRKMNRPTFSKDAMLRTDYIGRAAKEAGRPGRWLCSSPGEWTTGGGGGVCVSESGIPEAEPTGPPD